MPLSSDYIRQLDEQFSRWQAQAEMLLREIQANYNLVLAIDFSEIFQYMYVNEERHQMVSHIINNVNRQLTLPPGTCYELLWHADNTIGRPDTERWQGFRHRESVEIFIRRFYEASNDVEAQIKAYRIMDPNIRATLIELASTTRPGSPWKNVVKLLNKESFKPLGNFVDLDAIRLDPVFERKVRDQLKRARFSPEVNNMIDSLNFAVTYACNEWQSRTDKPNTYYAIFTGSPGVARVYDNYLWQDQKIVRQAEYLKIMANLNKEIKKDKEKYLQNCVKLIGELRVSINREIRQLDRNLRDMDAEKVVDRTVRLPVETIDKFKEFDDKYYYPLFSYPVSLVEEVTEREKAEQLYNLMKDEKVFRGTVEQAYSVMSQFFKHVERFYDSFMFESGDDIEQVRKTLEKLSGESDSVTTGEPEVKKS
jgi:hypothetical protein